MTDRQNKINWILITVAVLLAMEIIPFSMMKDGDPVVPGPRIHRFIIVPIMYMVMFYVNYFLLIPKFLSSKRFGLYLLTNLLLGVFVFLFCHFTFRIIEAPPPPQDDIHRGPPLFLVCLINLASYVPVIAISVAVRMTSEWYQSESIRKELDKSRSEAELQNLKSQLNPHFLFNTLNNIYSLIQIDTDRASSAVLNLSHLLRYVLYDSGTETVPLAKDLDFLKDYIELMRIRLPRHVDVDVSLPESPSNAAIAPLLFISPVENAFKHGVSITEHSFIKIDIKETEDGVSCRIENSYFPKNESDHSGSGIGLVNLSKRLEMIYPGKHVYNSGVKDDVYISEILISLR